MKLLLKAVVGFVAVVGVVVVLGLTCPDEANFKRWAQENIPPESKSVLEQAKGVGLTAQAKWTADYENHFLWATVDAYQGSARQHYFGLLGTWFQVGG